MLLYEFHLRKTFQLLGQLIWTDVPNSTNRLDNGIHYLVHPEYTPRGYMKLAEENQEKEQIVKSDILLRFSGNITVN